MSPSPEQRASDGGEWSTEAEKMVAEKNDRTLAALIRGIHDLERARDYQRALAGEAERPNELQAMAAKRLAQLEQRQSGAGSETAEP